MHNYELIATSDRYAEPKFKRIHESGILGEVEASLRIAAKFRAIYDEMGTVSHRQGQHGDDPVEVMADNYALDLEYELIGQLLLSAEGAVRMAQIRKDDWDVRVAEWQKLQDIEVEGGEA